MMLTKEELTAAIVASAAKLGRAPSRTELMKQANVSQRNIRKHFGTYNRALETCGIARHGVGQRVGMEELFLDWAGIARRLKKVPSLADYEQMSKYSVSPLLRRCGTWNSVPDAMKVHAGEHGLADEYKDVWEAIERRTGRQSNVPKPCAPQCVPKIMEDRPMYGPLLQGCPLVFAPTNEAGVLFLFGAMAERLGFLVLLVQTAFPDCQAMRVVAENRLQPVKIEVEYQSRNFLKHMHDLKGCDMIVCWEHNWPECPLEVLELKSLVKQFGGRLPESEKQNLTADERG